jgi:hypothetical protein
LARRLLEQQLVGSCGRPAGVLTGAAIASYPYWGDDGGGGCWQVRPTYDAYGNFLGQQSVNVC